MISNSHQLKTLSSLILAAVCVVAFQNCDPQRAPAEDDTNSTTGIHNPTPTPTPIPSPTKSPTVTPSPTRSPSPTPTPSRSPSPTPSPTKSPSPTPTPTATPSPTPMPTPVAANTFLSDTAKYSATTYRDLKYGTDSREILDLYVPKITGQTFPIVVFIHGGGWVAGYKTGDDTLDRFRAAIVGRGAAFANLEYRLATNSNGLQMADIVADVKGALRFLKAKATTYSLNPDYVIVMGESAGGHLSSFLATTQKNPSVEGNIGGNAGQYPTIRGLVDMYGPTDLPLLSKEWGPNGGGDLTEFLNHWLFSRCSSVSTCQAQFSPVTYVSADDPPALILQGGADDLVPPAQSEELNTALKNAGVKSKLVVYPGQGHAIDVKNSDFTTVYSFIKNIFQNKAPF